MLPSNYADTATYNVLGNVAQVPARIGDEVTTGPALLLDRYTMAASHPGECHLEWMTKGRGGVRDKPKSDHYRSRSLLAGLERQAKCDLSTRH